MKKLLTVIRYECETSFQYIWVFYLALACIIPAVSGIIFLLASKIGSINCLELNSIIFVSIVGILQMKEDFRMLMQNGFTRTYIFLGTMAQFVFISGLMSLVDTLLGTALRVLLSGYCNYQTIFGSLYGYGHPAVLGWLWLFLVYLLFSSLCFFFALALNRMPKKVSIFIGAAAGVLLILGASVLFGTGPWDSFKHRFAALAAKSFGFMADGTIRLVYPLFLLLLYAGLLNVCSYLFIRRAEINDPAAKSLFSLE